MKRVILVLLVLLAASSAFAQQTAPPARPGSTPPQRPYTAPPQGRPPAPVAPMPPPPVAQTGSATTPAPSRNEAYNQSLNWNIAIEFVITDTFSGAPVKKTVSMIVGNRQGGMIRTSNVVGGNEVLLNIDVSPTADGAVNGLIRLGLTMQYTPAPLPDTARTGPSRPAGLHESLTVNLIDGKSTLVSQSADPVSDRKVTLEVTARLLK